MMQATDLAELAAKVFDTYLAADIDQFEAEYAESSEVRQRTSLGNFQPQA